MEISDIDQEVSDFDWFAVGADGYILHFASAGGVLPTSVAASKEELALIAEHFNRLPETLQADKVQVIASIKQEKGVRYDSFLHYARRGLFSFDKTRLEARLDTFYQLIARPQHPLMLSDLPAEIAVILSKTRGHFSVAIMTKVDVSVIL
ncbi:hypothetical protein [Hymenobacter negativus]|uniref:Uncharacterized protein n=1 Tax=Hymenobacter negativus TaxID=2795026 RepID=A0ABS0Q6K8_9BACT|nr:hypothetical protein [Hymenobacter negativus]MBH8558290.1 hypothetical protein [Hymenobacter negativus]